MLRCYGLMHPSDSNDNRRLNFAVMDPAVRRGRFGAAACAPAAVFLNRVGRVRARAGPVAYGRLWIITWTQRA